APLRPPAQQFGEGQGHLLLPLFEPAPSSLMLHGINFSARFFWWVSPPFAHLAVLHLNSVRITFDVFHGMASLCWPALRESVPFVGLFR
ncbi:Os01g0302900, partial [Oryza sativa Japonica Group]